MISEAAAKNRWEGISSNGTAKENKESYKSRSYFKKFLERYFIHITLPVMDIDIIRMSN